MQSKVNKINDIVTKYITLLKLCDAFIVHQDTTVM